MKMLFKIAHSISSWIDAAAADFAALAVWLSAPKVIRLVEDESGGLVDETNNYSETLRASKHHVQMAGGLAGRGPVEAAAELSKTRVELVLRPDRFLFHPVELPAQAAEFLDGIVRAQLDRLTPWNAADAAFGWTKPIAAASGRIEVTVAAAPRTGIMPLLRPLLSSGARSIAVYTQAPGHEQSVGQIKVLEETPADPVALAKIRRTIVSILAATGMSAAVTVSLFALITINLDGKQKAVAERLAQVRGAASAARDGQGQDLAARKYSEPANVIVLEDLSRILPDHTYLTELRIEGAKVQLAGVTRDAPGLIGLLERSNRFAHATFFAPATRSPGEPDDHFHIEAQIQPLVQP